ncbi:MAG: 3-phosphoshikimate 1-carboxyvinyltransferase, partial [Myxococcales bacterium]|nr:3-phosphoshikimate 1-carboxyvinyltransferase [Myxococcales bacterium]
VVGDVRVPGDKSIGHRAVIFGSLATGTTIIDNFSFGEDNNSTVEIFRRLGVPILPTGPNRLQIHGVGTEGLRAPTGDLDCGNSGTTMRLLSGMLAGQPFESRLVGDESLSRRPMRRVIEPLRQMGAMIDAAREDNFPPLQIRGNTALQAIRYQLPVSSAQIKSCLLLAGMWAEGATQITDPGPSRDHTERMMQHFGVKLRRRGSSLVIEKPAPFEGREIDVPGDISSAAFFLALGAALPESELVVRRVGINATRTGVFDVMRQMGVELELLNVDESAGEPIADVLVRGSQLRGTTIEGEMVVRAIDEFPIICVLAAVARGTTRIRNAEELRVKESDRIAAMANELSGFGVPVEEHRDGLTIHGGNPLIGSRAQSYGDHRVAMSLAILGCLADGTTEIMNVDCIGTSFPTFRTILHELSR